MLTEVKLASLDKKRTIVESDYLALEMFGDLGSIMQDSKIRH